MLLDYIKNNYQGGEPIFISELPGKSKDSIRQELKSLVDRDELKRFSNGIYFLPYKNIFGKEGTISIDRYVDKKYLKGLNDEVDGYITGLNFANQIGITSQNPATIEVCSNQATTKQRLLDFGGNRIMVFAPCDEITRNNYRELQFLDLMTNIDRYSELSPEDTKKKVLVYYEGSSINFDVVKKYLPSYPDRVYRNIYNVGLMNELV